MVSTLPFGAASRRSGPWAVSGRIGLITLWLGLAGCERPQIAVYEAPKDAPPPAPNASPHGHGAASGMLPEGMPARPGLRWKTLPDGWTSRGAAGMRVANFSVSGKGPEAGDLAVIPLPGTGGSDLDLVNLWRGQLSLPPITAAELPSHTEETAIAGQPIKLFSIVGSGSTDASAAANQILVAALRKDGFTWFFKLAGDSETVAANREALKGFLADIEITPPESTPPDATAVAAAPSVSENRSAGAPKARWEVPEAWKAEPAPQMVHSKWKVATDAGSADVTVSVFPGETGGLTANLNRWRSQVGLPPAPEAELAALADNLDVLGGKATLADFAGSSPEDGRANRIVAAVVRRDGLSWFYKLLGHPAVVEANREAFVKFVQSAQYSRGS